VKNSKEVTVTAVDVAGGGVIVEGGGEAAALVMGWVPDGQSMPWAGRP